MDITIADGYELRAVDSMNLQLFERRQVRKKDGTAAEEWVALPSFHRTPYSAVLAVAERIPKARWRAVRVDFEGYLAEMRRVAAEVEESARRLERAWEGARP